jgi:hypothetical protein
MAAGPKAWFLATSTPSTRRLGCTEQKEARGGQDYVEQLTHSVTHVLVLHKNESVELGATVGVFEMAGVAANVALRLP